jgi:hypothetical protein
MSIKGNAKTGGELEADRVIVISASAREQVNGNLLARTQAEKCGATSSCANGRVSTSAGSALRQLNERD